MATRAEPSHIASLQESQSNIRNFCILAHVDHGKTTLSDSLVSSNGIISAKLAGKLRYLDSTEEEQKRGITMHSSAISLLYKMEEKGAATDAQSTAAPEEFLVNLIDSPGHIDFSSDVSTATRLCDGALLVVDVLEGICTQTHAVVYKALKERMRPCLVLNKIDRLFIEMKLSTTEAFHHLKRLLEQVNALAYTLLKSELLKRDNISDELKNNNNSSTILNTEHTINAEIEDDLLFQQWNFEPDKGNVIFCSALDCWGFGTPKFATIWAKRLEINRNVLRKYIFEDCAFNPSTKKIVKLDTSRGAGALKPMFASMVLDPLWQLYETAIVQQDVAKAANMANKGFGVVLPPREINPRDTRATLQAILRRWLPLSDAVLRMIIRTVPDPITAQQQRLFTLLPGVVETVNNTTEHANSSNNTGIDYESTQLPLEETYLPREEGLKTLINRSYECVKQSIAVCDNAAAAPVVVFVSKMVPVRVAELSPRDVAMMNTRLARSTTAVETGENNESSDMKTPPKQLQPDGEVFMALARVFSGTLQRNTPLYVLGSKYNPLSEPITEMITSDMPSSGESRSQIVGLTPLPTDLSVGLYIMLGPSVVPVDHVPAGNIVGILGLSDCILKTATLSSTWATFPMTSITFQSRPMLKVAVEPTTHQDLRSLEHGLQQLHQFDPVVEIGIDKDTGQNTMTCLGELHLEQCVKALTERFAKCPVNVSEPLIAFRETILSTTAAAATNSNMIATANNTGTGNTSVVPLLPPPWSEIPGLTLARNGRYRILFGSDNIAITVRCFPLHMALIKTLEDHVLEIHEIDEKLSEFHRKLSSLQDTSEINRFASNLVSKYPKFWSNLENKIAFPKTEIEEEVDVALKEILTSAATAMSSTEEGEGVQGVCPHILSIGSHFQPTNLLLLGKEATVSIYQTATLPPTSTTNATSTTANSNTNNINNTVFRTSVSENAVQDSNNTVAGSVNLHQHPDIFYKLWSRLHSACVAAFAMATEAGPLMREPMHGVGFVVEEVEINTAIAMTALSPAECELVSAAVATPSATSPTTTAMVEVGSSTILTGQVISELKEALHIAMLSLPVRIVEPVYKCDLQCDQSQLGNLYAVLSQRRGEVTNEDIIEGTSLFLLSAHLPVYSSFGFAQQLLKKTSGLGTAPQLSFSHWSRLETDPFWRPTTEDELEEFGEFGANIGGERSLPRLIIDTTRKRKGLAIEEKVVMYAEKQRTLNKKK